jgi:hypothetical protein
LFHRSIVPLPLPFPPHIITVVVAFAYYATVSLTNNFGAFAKDGETPVEGAIPVYIEYLKVVYPTMQGIEINVGLDVELLNATFYDPETYELQADVIVYLNDASVKFLKKQYPTPQKLVISMFGDQTIYPFSTYQGWIIVGATFGQLEDIVPVALTTIDNTYGFDVKSSYDPNNPYPNDIWGITFLASHSANFMVYPIVAMLMMALIGLTLMFAAYTVATSPYAVIKDTKAFLPALAALIFALPKYRMELPFAPPLGSLIDYVIFYWVNLMPLVAFVVVMWKHLANILAEQVEMQMTEDERRELEAKEKGIVTRKKLDKMV